MAAGFAKQGFGTDSPSRAETKLGGDGVQYSWISGTMTRHIGLVLTGRDDTTDRPLVLSTCIARMACKSLTLVQ